MITTLMVNSVQEDLVALKKAKFAFCEDKLLRHVFNDRPITTHQSCIGRDLLTKTLLSTMNVLVFNFLWS